MLRRVAVMFVGCDDGRILFIWVVDFLVVVEWV
jgi:hypothetical protein